MPVGYLLDKTSIETLRRDHNRLRHQVQNMHQYIQQSAHIAGITAATNGHLVRVTEQITKGVFDGLTIQLGSGRGTPQYRDTQGKLQTASTRAITIYNWSTEDSGDPENGLVLIWAQKSTLDGRYYYLNEPCLTELAT